MASTASNGRLKDAVAIVTGSARGVGVEIARRLGQEGAKVFLTDIEPTGLVRTAEIVREAGAPDVAYIDADLSREDGAQKVIDAAKARWGRIDILVNNAGGGHIRPFLDHTPDTLRETLERNLWTTIWCCRSVLPVMIAQSYGRIVNIGAESVRNGLWSHAGYNAAKGGVNGLTTGLAREFAGNKITVNTVAPAGIMTPEIEKMLDPTSDIYGKHQIVDIRPIIDAIPAKRLAAMEDVASMVVYLALPEAGYVTGQVISVNGGSSML